MKRESITFARNLKNLRNSQKLTMQQMAEKLGAIETTTSLFSFTRDFIVGISEDNTLCFLGQALKH